MNLNSETLGPIRRILAVGGVALAGSIALTGCGILEDAASDSTTDNEVSDEQVDAVADAKVGDCLPEEMISADPSIFAVDCSDPTAFWTITAFEADPGLTANTDGSSLTDPQPVFDMCGETVGAQVPGATWTDWSMIYDQTTYTVDYIFCVESNGVPSSLGTNPVVPAAGDCFNSMAAEYQYGTLPCDSPDVDSTVVDVVEVDPAEWMGADANAEALAADCSGDYTAYLPAVDQFGRTAAVYCLA
jgi:hypothetical protein